MNGRFTGALIKKYRLEKSWSQEGLCKGICAVSYLSKIEQGKTEANPEIIRLLLERLDAEWFDDAATCRRADELSRRLYDAFFSLDEKGLERAGKEMDADWNTLSHCPRILDFLLFRAVRAKEVSPLLREFAPSFDERQKSLWLALQEKYEELLLFSPSAYAYEAAGVAAYRAGQYPMALEHLQRGYNLAAEQGFVSIMLECRIFMGNCYSDMMEFGRMQEHFRVAERLATALGDSATLGAIRYNTASTYLEMDLFKEGYAYFSTAECRTAMEWHKLAVCCEKLGKTGEAVSALDRAQQCDDAFPPKELSRAMCELVRYRLLHPEYLRENAYGEMLLSCFGRIRKELPVGFARFHLPWVLEWYAAARKYKEAYELLLEFPYYKCLIPV